MVKLPNALSTTWFIGHDCAPSIYKKFRIKYMKNTPYLYMQFYFYSTKKYILQLGKTFYLNFVFRQTIWIASSVLENKAIYGSYIADIIKK